jgi:hypothetical protein
MRMAREDRIHIWRSMVAACAELADDLNEVLQMNRLPERLKRL